MQRSRCRLSPEALKTAEENGRLLKVDDRIQWKLGDYLEPLGDDAFDGILTNPPYIAREEMAALSEEVRHEPVMALDGGPDGLDFYRKLAMEGWKSIKKRRIPGGGDWRKADGGCIEAAERKRPFRRI